MAELKAQIDDQEFVNRVCYVNLAGVLDLYERRAEVPIVPRLRYFFIVCEILSHRLIFEDVSDGDCASCAALLTDRLHKLDNSGQLTDELRHLKNVWQARIDEWIDGDVSRRQPVSR